MATPSLKVLSPCNIEEAQVSIYGGQCFAHLEQHFRQGVERCHLFCWFLLDTITFHSNRNSQYLEFCEYCRENTRALKMITTPPRLKLPSRPWRHLALMTCQTHRAPWHLRQQQHLLHHRQLCVCRRLLHRRPILR
jgi:hypothetical protein